MNVMFHLPKFCKMSFTSRLSLGKHLFIYSNGAYAHVSNLSLLKTKIPVLTSARTFWESYPYRRPNLHEKDGLDTEHHQLIYRAKLFNYAFYGQIVSLTTFAVQIIMGSYRAYLSYITKGPLMVETIGSYTITYDLMTLVILGILTLQNFAIFAAAQSALLRIYYKKDTDEYVFVTLALNPFKSRLLYCKPGELQDLQIRHIGGIFGNYRVKGRRIFLRSDNFKNIWHYNRLSGYIID